MLVAQYEAMAADDFPPYPLRIFGVVEKPVELTLPGIRGMRRQEQSTAQVAATAATTPTTNSSATGRACEHLDPYATLLCRRGQSVSQPGGAKRIHRNASPSRAYRSNRRPADSPGWKSVEAVTSVSTAADTETVPEAP